MGSFSILNNPASINGQHQLNLNNVNLARTLQRMSSGMRINTGADDAAGLQIADSLRANVYALNQGIRNANDGISYLQIADGALSEITGLLTRMVTLASQAATETVDAAGRRALNNEFQTIQEEIARIAKDTNFNGSNIFDRGRDFEDTLDLFVGDLSTASDGGYIKVKVGYIDVASQAILDADEWAAIAAKAAGLTNANGSEVTTAAQLTTVLTSLNNIASLDSTDLASFTLTTADQGNADALAIALGIAPVTIGNATQEAKLLEALGLATTTSLTGGIIDIRAAIEKVAIPAAQAKIDLHAEIDAGRDKIWGFGLAKAEDTSDASLIAVNLLTHSNAAGAFQHIKASLDAIATMRGDIGAGMNRLQASISVMQTQSRNTLAAESSIRDANMAEEITNLTKFQILAQTGIAALSHSNANSQIVLRLLQ